MSKRLYLLLRGGAPRKKHEVEDLGVLGYDRLIGEGTYGNVYGKSGGDTVAKVVNLTGPLVRPKSVRFNDRSFTVLGDSSFKALSMSYAPGLHDDVLFFLRKGEYKGAKDYPPHVPCKDFRVGYFEDAFFEQPELRKSCRWRGNHSHEYVKEGEVSTQSCDKLQSPRRCLFAAMELPKMSDMLQDMEAVNSVPVQQLVDAFGDLLSHFERRPNVCYLDMKLENLSWDGTRLVLLDVGSFKVTDKVDVSNIATLPPLDCSDGGNCMCTQDYQRYAVGVALLDALAMDVFFVRSIASDWYKAFFWYDATDRETRNLEKSNRAVLRFKCLQKLFKKRKVTAEQIDGSPALLAVIKDLKTVVPYATVGELAYTDKK